MCIIFKKFICKRFCSLQPSQQYNFKSQQARQPPDAAVVQAEKPLFGGVHSTVLYNFNISMGIIHTYNYLYDCAAVMNLIISSFFFFFFFGEQCQEIISDINK